MKVDRILQNRKDANTAYFDGTLRHAIALRRFTNGEVKRLIKLLEKSDQELSKQLRQKLAALVGKPPNFTTKRWKALLKDIRQARNLALGKLKGELTPSLQELTKMEIDFEQRIAQAAIPVNVEFASVVLERITSDIFKRPFSGGTNAAKTLQQWFDGVSRLDQAKIIEALQLGVIQGETIDQMMRRVAGSKTKGFTDGVLSLTRRNAETIIRTAINHISNAAREAFFKENNSVVTFLRWTSTLDGRTSAICRARDGKLVQMGDEPIPSNESPLQPQTARPPALPNCRSLMVGVFSIDGVIESIGERPFVRGNKRKLNFRQQAKDKVGEEQWKKLTAKQRNGVIKEVKTAWSRKNIGQVPDIVTYQEWLKRQPAEFQDEVLGKTKGKLFRDGGLTLDKFVDIQGNELTLKQLKLKDPAAFVAAGLDVNKF